jgi:hypothetical protein
MPRPKYNIVISYTDSGNNNVKYPVKSAGKPVVASNADEALDEFQYLNPKGFLDPYDTVSRYISSGPAVLGENVKTGNMQFVIPLVKKPSGGKRSRRCKRGRKTCGKTRRRRTIKRR